MTVRLMTAVIAATLILAALAALLGGCGPARRGEPQGPEVRPDDVVEAAGARLFARFCYQCHPNGEAGLGPALNDKPLPAIAIRTQIRQGVGAMPAFGDELLDDAEVAAIAEYVQELRGTPATRRLSSASSE